MVGFFETTRKEAKAKLIAWHPSAYWGYRKLRRGWAEREMEVLPALCLPGTLAVDVGANHGLFVHDLTRLCRHVHAFEASPRMAEILRRGYSRRGNVSVHEVALSNAAGTATLRIPRFLGASGYATLETGDLGAKTDVGAGVDEVQVPTRPLDEFDLRNVSFVKVDVEGHEQEVLEGATETLRRESAIVLAELEERHRTNAVRDVGTLMGRIGYQGYFLEGRSFVPWRRFAPLEHQNPRWPKRYVRNFLFVAPTRLPDLAAQLKHCGHWLVP